MVYHGNTIVHCCSTIIHIHFMYHRYLSYHSRHIMCGTYHIFSLGSEFSTAPIGSFAELIIILSLCLDDSRGQPPLKLFTIKSIKPRESYSECVSVHVRITHKGMVSKLHTANSFWGGDEATMYHCT